MMGHSICTIFRAEMCCLSHQHAKGRRAGDACPKFLPKSLPFSGDIFSVGNSCLGHPRVLMCTSHAAFRLPGRSPEACIWLARVNEAPAAARLAEDRSKTDPAKNAMSLVPSLRLCKGALGPGRKCTIRLDTGGFPRWLPPFLSWCC